MKREKRKVEQTLPKLRAAEPRQDAHAQAKRERWEQISPALSLLKTEEMEYRGYLFKIARTIYEGANTLVIIPTSTRKTSLAFMTAAKAMHEGKKALIVAPTTPLVAQHYEKALEAFRDPSQIALVTGATKDPDKRAELYKNARLIIATPHTIRNDIEHSKFPLMDLGSISVDEGQKTRGGYPYAVLGKYLKGTKTQRVLFTGSLTSRQGIADSIIEIFDITRIEARNRRDLDIAPYVNKIETKVVRVNKSTHQMLLEDRFNKLMDRHFQVLKNAGLSDKDSFQKVSKRDFNDLGIVVKKMVRDVHGQPYTQRRDFIMNVRDSYKTLYYLSHPFYLVTTQGFRPTLEYLVESKEEKGRRGYMMALFKSREMQDIEKLLKDAKDHKIEHPKVATLIKGLLHNKDEKAITFANFRSTVNMLAEHLDEAGIPAQTLMGKRARMTIEEQQKMIVNLSSGKSRVMVSTSIGEEGIDIPNVPLVIAYDAVPSAIRNVQRRGRTGRTGPGRFVQLVAKGTSDEVYLSIASLNETKMNRLVVLLRKQGEEMQSKSKSPTKEPAKPPQIQMTLQEAKESAAADFMGILLTGKTNPNPTKQGPPTLDDLRELSLMLRSLPRAQRAYGSAKRIPARKQTSFAWQ